MSGDDWKTEQLREIGEVCDAAGVPKKDKGGRDLSPAERVHELAGLKVVLTPVDPGD